MVCHSMGKKDWVRYDSSGFTGGVWWNMDEFNLRIVHVEKNFIHLMVDEGGAKPWELTAIYASPVPSKRPAIWNKLCSIRGTDPWVIIGDFNCTLKDGDRSSEGGVSTSFVQWVQEVGFMDIGFIGQRYTWSHGKKAETRRSARLDRVLVTMNGEGLFRMPL